MPPEPAAAGVPDGTAGRRPGLAEVASTDAAGRLRLLAYALGLCVAFALYVLVQGPGQGAAFWAGGLGVGLLLASGIVGQVVGPRAGRDAMLARPFRWGVAGAVALALLVPLAGPFAAGEPLAGLVAAHPLWPTILVALFGSRTLAEIDDLRFAALWRAPLAARPPAALQSGAAAVALGGALALLFYQALWFAAPARGGATTLTAMVASALSGETAIHRAIVFLFFVILAYLCDAALRHRRDREALAALQPLLAASRIARGPALAGALADALAADAHTRPARLLARALAPGRAEGRAVQSADPFDGFHGAARRFVRGLLPFLPLLGFFGTVVGLATAMAALPTAGGAAGVDLSGSLSGLALKFETTLLGILASMIASLLLALLEKGEAELAAECALLAEAAQRPGGPVDGA